MIAKATYHRHGGQPMQPTAALPGSEEKIRVMTERAERREQLFHPLDGPGYQGGQAAAPEAEFEAWPMPTAEELPDEPVPPADEVLGLEDDEPARYPSPALIESDSTG